MIAGYDDERAVFNLNHELTPAVIRVVEVVANVQAAVVFAAGQHRPVLVKTTRHQIIVSPRCRTPSRPGASCTACGGV